MSGGYNKAVNYILRLLLIISTRVNITSRVPAAITIHTQSGVAGSGGAGNGVDGGGSVWKLKVALHSLGMGCPLTSMARTLQK
jgi:hypothetical protein